MRKWTFFADAVQWVYANAQGPVSVLVENGWNGRLQEMKYRRCLIDYYWELVDGEWVEVAA